MAQATPEQGKKKTRILTWRGVLTGRRLSYRLVIGGVLVLTSVVLTFTQLGFVSVPLPDGNVAYVVVLLQVVGLGALLLGTLPGGLIGLLSGVVLYIHAQFLPLNAFELMFITPLTSVILFTVTGLLSGLLFAFALRNDPPLARSIVYIVIVCVVVAVVYSVGFTANVILSLTVSFVQVVGPEVSEELIDQLVDSAARRLGNLDVQTWLTAALLAAACAITFAIARKVEEHKGTYGLRTVFGVSLTVAVVLAFMAMSATSYLVSTRDELQDAERAMTSELDYLCQQLQEGQARDRSVLEFVDKHFEIDSMDTDTALELLDAVSGGNVLERYDAEENGIALVLFSRLIDASNDDRFPKNELYTEVLSDETVAAIEAALQTGTMQRFVFEAPMHIDGNVEEASESYERPYIAYLVAKSFTYENMGGDTFEYRVILIRDSQQVFTSRDSVMLWSAMSTLALMIIVGVVVFLLLNFLVARRIDEENDALGRITAGDLEVKAEAGGTREFESLSDGINTTVDAMKGWISEAETRMDAELATAKAIQESALPRTFPPFPDILKFDIYASMTPAKQVGGDFYDFFLIGNDSGPDGGKLGFVVADVSGKGVPAALFMMEAKSQIRNYVSSGMELGEAVAEVNRQMCDGNDAGMFVTAWVGVLDYATGHIDYVNAGHNPPLLWSFAGDDEAPAGAWRWLTEKSGLPLGLFDGLPYEAHTLECLPGDQLLMYSDGVTEAMDPNGNLYGEERLMALAEKHYLLHPRDLLGFVRRDVAAHAAGAERSDDITILVLEVGVPPEVSAMLDVPAETAHLADVNAFLHDELDKRLCPKRVQNQLDIAVEELFVNVCHYAYEGVSEEVPRMVHVRRTYSADPPSIVVELIDEGVPYNPLAKPDAVTPDDIMDVPIGGLGILMAKHSVDEMHYERADGFNIVTIVKRW